MGGTLAFAEDSGLNDAASVGTTATRSDGGYKLDGIKSFVLDGNTADLILADLNMPNLSGKEFLRTLRSSSYYRKIPVVILSAENESNERIACLNMGADDFIEKPFNPVEVLTKINVILRRTRSEY